MSVELDPPELGFRRPFTHEVTQILRLRNPHNEPLAFKVKTTAPKQYCVRPNSGYIPAGQGVEVQVLLQAMKEDPPLDARCRDKFLVQSVVTPPDADLSNVAAIWQSVEKSGKDAIKERKIRVTFLPAHDSSSQQSGVNGIAHPDDAPPAYRSPSPTQFGSPTGAGTSSSSATYADNKSFTTPMKESASSASGTASGIATNVSSTISNAAASTSETLQQQLEAAKAQIARLTEQAGDSGLRQRKTDAVVQDAREKISTGTTGLGVQSQPANGVPVQIVAALCLLSFLLAYFFF